MLTAQCITTYPAILCVWHNLERMRALQFVLLKEDNFSYSFVSTSFVFIHQGFLSSLSQHIAFWDSLEPSKWAVPPADKPGGSGGVVLNEVRVFLLLLLTTAFISEKLFLRIHRDLYHVCTEAQN